MAVLTTPRGHAGPGGRVTADDHSLLNRLLLSQAQNEKGGEKVTSLDLLQIEIGLRYQAP